MFECFEGQRFGPGVVRLDVSMPLFTDVIIAVKSRLLPVMIQLGLLLLHIGEHTKQLVFVLWRGSLDIGGCPPEARRSQCLGSMWLIDGWLTDRVPNGADGFAL